MILFNRREIDKIAPERRRTASEARGVGELLSFILECVILHYLPRLFLFFVHRERRKSFPMSYDGLLSDALYIADEWYTDGIFYFLMENRALRLLIRAAACGERGAFRGMYIFISHTCVIGNKLNRGKKRFLFPPITFPSEVFYCICLISATKYL